MDETKLLQMILELLQAAGIESISEALSAIKEDTEHIEDIADNTAPISSINNTLGDIDDTTGNIDNNVADIKINSDAIASIIAAINTKATDLQYLSGIATSSSTSATFSEQIATNTLECKNKLNAISADTSETVTLLRQILEELDTLTP